MKTIILSLFSGETITYLQNSKRFAENYYNLRG